MKHLKYFESKVQIKVGDIVKCLTDTGAKAYLKTDEYYIINDIVNSINKNQPFISINGLWWAWNRFRLATPQEIEQLKYNL